MCLTPEKIYKNKMSYLNLLNKLDIDLVELTRYLENVDYFNKPASTQFFRPYAGGLCQYALDVYFELGQLCNAYFPGKYTEQDIIKVALFKDIYRAELYEQYNKNTKDDSGNWVSVVAYKYKETRPTFGDLGFSSYMIAKHFVDFTDEQIEAITQSSTKDCYAGDIHDILRSYPLATLTKMADLVANYLEQDL